MTSPVTALPADVRALNSQKKRFKVIPAEAALLVIDMQEFFLNEASHAHIEEGEAAIPSLNRLNSAFRNAGSPVVFTRHNHRKGTDAGTMGKWWADLMWEGGPFLDIDPRLDLHRGDKVIEKDRYDAFFNTPLERYLRSRGVKQVVITGVMTDLCCETTARSAFCRDFKVFFVYDCTATVSEDLHLGTLRNLTHGFAVLVGSPELLTLLGAAVSSGIGRCGRRAK